MTRNIFFTTTASRRTIACSSEAAPPSFLKPKTPCARARKFSAAACSTFTRNCAASKSNSSGAARSISLWTSCRTREELTTCTLLRASRATASPPPPGSARNSPASSAAIPTTFPLTASSFPPLHLACAAATPGRFLSPVPITKFSIGSHRDSLERPSLRTKRAFLLLTSLLPYFLTSLHLYLLTSSFHHLHSAIHHRPQQHRHRPPLSRKRIAPRQRHHAHHQRRGHHVKQPGAAPRDTERPLQLGRFFAQLPRRQHGQNRYPNAQPHVHGQKLHHRLLRQQPINDARRDDGDPRRAIARVARGQRRGQVAVLSHRRGHARARQHRGV